MPVRASSQDGEQLVALAQPVPPASAMLPSGSGAVQNTDRICSVVAHVHTEFQDCVFELRIVL